ncbi:MAG TPA: 4Fe-4S ferredoxin, partial [bacterium]|nr:4Fe-4S ferredoxin [bacterium]
PKLDDAAYYIDKLSEIIVDSELKSIKIIRMEVPCCSGLVRIAKAAVEKSGRGIPVTETVIGIRGAIGEERLV